MCAPPAHAAPAAANAFAQAYLETNLDIKTDPARKDAAWFDDQVKAARDKLETAQKRLADYQQKNKDWDSGPPVEARRVDSNRQPACSMTDTNSASVRARPPVTVCRQRLMMSR